MAGSTGLGNDELFNCWPWTVRDLVFCVSHEPLCFVVCRFPFLIFPTKKTAERPVDLRQSQRGNLPAQ